MNPQNIKWYFIVNKNFLYKINLKRNKPKLGNVSDLLLQLASPTYILSGDTDIADLDLVELEDGEYGFVEKSENVKLKKFQGFRIYQASNGKLTSTRVPWISDDERQEHSLEVVYFCDSIEGLFIKIYKSKGFNLRRVLNKESYSLEMDAC